MMRFLLLFSFFLSYFSMFSQTEITGIIADMSDRPNEQVVIEYWNEDSWKQLTTTPIALGKFKVTVNWPVNGQYRIRISTRPRNWSDFIVVKESMPKSMMFQCSVNQLNNEPSTEFKDDENLAYQAFAKIYNPFFSGRDSVDKRNMAHLRSELSMIERLQEIKKTHPNSFTSKFIIPVASLPIAPEWQNSNPSTDSIFQFNKIHALDNWPFESTEIMHHQAIVRSLNQYYYYFREDSSADQYIDKVLARSMANEPLNTFLFRFTLEKMLDYKNENGLTYLLTWYAPDCSDNESLSSNTKNLILALENCKPGNTFPNLVLPDLAGNRIDLHQLTKKNKVTIVMFWRSNCNHCAEFEPLLQSIYAKYKSMGVEVYAIGSDKEEADWRKKATEQNAPWKSVFLSYDSRKDFSKKYPVPSTPTLIAIDANGKVLRRLIMRSKLEIALDEMLELIK
ncbi:MAG: TlpA family protein disulfide reductase [Flavobacteriales bacterium]